MGNQPIITVFEGARVTHVTSAKGLELRVAGFLDDIQIGFLPNTLQLSESEYNVSGQGYMWFCYLLRSHDCQPSAQSFRVLVNCNTKKVTKKCVQPGDKMFNSHNI